MRPRTPFFLIRHGQTDWNYEGRFQGQTDIAMNETGKAQARANGAQLAGFEQDWSQWRFVSSPLGRTRETMELVRAELGLDPKTYETDPRLMELTFGDWEGSTIAELNQTIPEAVKQRHEEKWTYRQPNGENYEDGLTRVRAFFADLEGPAVIVTHGGIVRVMRHVLEELEKDQAAHLSAPQDQVYQFDGKTGRYL